MTKSLAGLSLIPIAFCTNLLACSDDSGNYVGASGSHPDDSGAAGNKTGGTGGVPTATSDASSAPEAGTSGSAAACASGQVDCGAGCVDVATSTTHCGACNVACVVGQSCSSGTCVCSTGLELCAGACVDTRSDAAHCGGCGAACPADQVCSGGQCAATCQENATQCGRSCVDVTTNVAHCGGCNQACAAGQGCVGGSCVCGAGQQLCNGACTDLSNDEANCGACAAACAAGQTCSAGQCTVAGGTGGSPGTVGGTGGDTGVSEPGTGGAEPSTGGAEPGTGGAEASVGGSDPGTAGAEPGTGGADPGTGGSNSGTGGAPGTAGAPSTAGVPGTGGVSTTDEPVIPPVTGDCPVFETGSVTVGGLSGISLEVGPMSNGTGALVFYWHGTGTFASEYASMLGGVVDQILDEGGIIVSFQSSLGTGGDCSGTSTFSKDDFNIADQIAACAVRDYNIDPHRIYTTGCSAGGLQAGCMATMRSSYVAAAVPNSGGIVLPQEFDDSTHTPALMTMHGGASDWVVVSFADTSQTLDEQFNDAGGFVVNCDHGGGHCSAPAELQEAGWEFMKAHPFGVDPEPYESGLPATFPDYCVAF